MPTFGLVDQQRLRNKTARLGVREPSHSGLAHATGVVSSGQLLPYRHFGAFRLLLAGLVVFQHFTANAAPDWLSQDFAGFSPGSGAVLVFFVMSGFVIAEAVDRFYAAKPFAFIGNRLLRIAPHFVLTILISFALHTILFHAGTLRPGRDVVLPPNFVEAFNVNDVLLNCIGFLPIPLRRWAHYDFLSVAWAIRIEMAFYLSIFASLLLMAWSRAPRQYRSPAMAVIATLLYAASATGMLSPKIGLVAYFAFGYSLYTALMGSRLAGWFAFACLPAIGLSFLAHPTNLSIGGAPASYMADFLLLAGLLTLLVCLARANFARWRRIDKFLGDLSYPWYMYHINVLIIVLSLTADYSVGVYLGGMMLSLIVSAALSLLIDPLVTRLRDRVRGRSLTTRAVFLPSPTRTIVDEHMPVPALQVAPSLL